MNILSMTATFGKLDGETLVLTDGLNVLSAPNEWGKSTWCAFLTAMLYGIDTRERSRADQLADKEKYLPWSGKPMEGTIRLIHEGRDITIQRRTRGRTPMGEFLAWETGTGLQIRELTAENCGLTLLGVEKSVFLRTGFLRFSDLPVKADEALRHRLNALVTTGDESGDAEKLGAKLRELKNRCRHNRTGLIPECQTQIRKTQEQLWDRQTMQKQHDALCQRIIGQERELELLENHRQALLWQESRDGQQRVEDARVAARTAVLLERALMEKYTDNKDLGHVEARIRQGEKQLAELEVSREEPPDISAGAVLTALAALAVLFTAILMADQGLLAPCLGLATVLLIICLIFVGRQRRRKLWYTIEQTRRQGKIDELNKFLASWRGQQRLLEELERARESVNRTQNHLNDLESLVRAAEEPEFPDELTMTREETHTAIGEMRQQLDSSRMQLAQLRGRMEDLPDEEQLQQQLAQLRRRLAELERTSRAIGYAESALESAMQQLQRRFAPQITRRAGILLSALTDGAYDRLSIDEDLTLLAAREGETTLRSAFWRSEGTADLMYLALRLAVWETLSPSSPLILDDALIRFDQTRLEKTMELLKELGKNRQILLLSCQDRERQFMERT